MEDLQPKKPGRMRRIWNRVRPLPAEELIPVEDIPVDMQLRRPHPISRLYEKLRPRRYIMQLDYRHDREFLSDFMPVSLETYIGRGSYKHVYRLPGNKAVKIGRSVLPSNPLFGDHYQKISKAPHLYLENNEMRLMDYMCSRYRLEKNRRAIRRKFYRLALERLHYEMVKRLVPDLVVPTTHFMALSFREMLFSKKVVPELQPADTQPLLAGRHLKEFVGGATREKQGMFMEYISPQWKVVFNSTRFGHVKRRQLKKLKEDMERVVDLCGYFAGKHRLILDLHSENLIITLPNFEIKLFDFHLFDAHLYEVEERGLNPEQEHIEMIELFINSFGLEED